jgi:hypothetical protein
MYHGQKTEEGDRMTFLQAKTELKEMAKGEYHSLSYEMTEYSDGEIRVECRVYIHGHEHSYGGTWEEALSKMRVHMFVPEPSRTVLLKLEGAPL